MTIKIIFFFWFALVPENDYKVPDDVEKYFGDRCAKAGGHFGKWRSGTRKYSFEHDGITKTQVYSGYDFICFKVLINT